MDMKLATSAITVPISMISVSAMTVNNQEIITSNVNHAIYQEKAISAVKKEKFIEIENKGNIFICSVSTNENNEDVILNKVQEILSRSVTINYRYDNDIDRYFLAIQSDEVTFDNDYSKLDDLDLALENVLYKGKPVIATLEESDV